MEECQEQDINVAVKLDYVPFDRLTSCIGKKVCTKASALHHEFTRNPTGKKLASFSSSGICFRV